MIVRNVRYISAIMAMSALFLTGCASHQPTPSHSVTLPETGFTVHSSLRYSPDTWPEPLYADLYVPERTDPAPVVLMVHGGGWERRSRSDMTWVAESLASQGFAVLNVDYRFAPDFTFPAQLHDLQIARHWLNRNAGRYGLDTSRVTGFGFSSGAHLVALLATVASTDSDLNRPHGGPETALKAAVAGGLPADLPAFGSGRLLRQLLGAELEEQPDRYQRASPVTHVSAATPPFFLFHGTMDMLVPFSQAERFAEALDAQGVYHEIYRMRLRGHVTSFLTAGNAVDQAARFLARQGAGPQSAQANER
ncbi:MULTISPECIES: alpha/beta hydrolase [Marinobacter]|uniref:Alpha/beta hydrolase n=1 Tax=Marinobacter alkaliphilus TaxID=254719 RepID=A0ABZ3E4H8_9GAMM|nr:alpha/beta hydrolase [Marinobacter shengliensis]BEH12714.1 lipase [Marinobacter shengliensis]